MSNKQFGRKRPLTTSASSPDLNQYMHERNIYKQNSPDYAELAKLYKNFKPFVHYTGKGSAYINFKDPMAVRELTYTLLKKDFDIKLDIPLDMLCPPVPNRLNYILWLEDLLAETDPNASSDGTIYGIDMYIFVNMNSFFYRSGLIKMVYVCRGTGASCIYPLLGCATNNNWKFVATDINTRSIEFARKNIIENKLQERISVFLNLDSNKVLPLREIAEQNPIEERFAFCMCNPPFYESLEQIEQNLQNKSLPPSAACTGSETEMITPGGEFQFIMSIVNESLTLKDRITWYTSMIGRRETLDKIVQELLRFNINNYVITEFSQGRTRRWGIGWSFGDHRPKIISEPFSKKLKPVRPLYHASFTGYTLANMKDSLDSLFREFNIPISWNEEKSQFLGSPKENTWSRAARRKRLRESQQRMLGDKEESERFSPQTMNDKSHIFEFRCQIMPQKEGRDIEIAMELTMGKDKEMFIGFWNHIKNRLKNHEEFCKI